MATVRKYLSKKSQSSNNYEILLRVSISREIVFRIKSGIFIEKIFWDEKREKCIIPRTHTQRQIDLIELQSKLDSLVTLIINQCIITDSIKIDKNFIEKIIHKFHFGEEKETENITSKENMFFSLFEEFISLQVKTANRIAQFKTLERMIKRYTLFRGKNFNLDIDSFNDIDLNQFEEFLRIEHTFFDKKGKCIKHKNIYELLPEKRVPKPRGTNGIHYIMKRFRTFSNWANKTDRTKNNPFAKYKMPSCVYGTPYFITTEERNLLYQYDFSANASLEIQRDIFVFQSCIGIRPRDLYKLTWDNVIDNSIEYIANKTIDESAQTVIVPLIRQAKEILERYKDKKRKTLLPFVSMQLSIKEMLKQAGITRKITILNPITRKNEQHPIWEVATSYMGRRNFIGNLYKKVKDLNIIGSMTGHAEGSKAFARYRDIDTDIKKSTIIQLE